MKKFLFPLLMSGAVACSAFGYEGPSPLKNVKVETSTVFDDSNGIYSYSYRITNPASNDGEINTISVSIGRDSATDADVSSSGLSHCPHHSASAQMNLAQTPMVNVGSSTPNGWSCDYGKGEFVFGCVYERDAIKPGASSAGYVLKSFAPPGIREVSVAPTIDIDRLPDIYNEDADKLESLEKNLTWTGKTIGPKAPPKVFVALSYLDYLISLKDQSVALRWITEKNIEKDLNKIFARAKKKLGQCDERDLKEAIGELTEELNKHSRKGLSPEARALLLYNSKYFISQLPKLSKADREKCEHQHEHDGERKGDR